MDKRWSFRLGRHDDFTIYYFGLKTSRGKIEAPFFPFAEVGTLKDEEAHNQIDETDDDAKDEGSMPA